MTLATTGSGKTLAAFFAGIDAALRDWLALQPRGRRVVVSRWNGESPLGTAAEATLARAGFGRDPNVMSLYR